MRGGARTGLPILGRAGVALAVVAGAAALLVPAKVALGVFLAVAVSVVIFFQPYLGMLIFAAFFYLQPTKLIPSLGPYHLTRNLGVVTIAALAISLVVRPERKLVRGTHERLVLCFTMVAALSACTHLALAFPYFIDFLKMVMLYFLIVNLVRERRAARGLVWVLVTSGTLIGLYGIWQHTNDIGVWEGYGGIYRVGGTIGDPNDFALYLVILLPLALELTILTPSRPLRLLLVGMMICLLTAIIYTYSRGGLLGMATVLGLSGLRYSLQKGRWRYVMLLAPVFLALVIKMAPSHYWSRGRTIADSQEQSANERLGAWLTGWNMLRGNPLTGVGIGQFQENYLDYVAAGAQTRRKMAAHNMYVQVAAETGLFGGGLFVSLLVATLVALHRAAKKHAAEGAREMLGLTRSFQIALVGYAACGTFLSVGYLAVLWMLIAAGVAISRIPGNVEDQSQSQQLPA